jgi:membrane protein implicated in regulation of membrane protease activity
VNALVLAAEAAVAGSVTAVVALVVPAVPVALVVRLTKAAVSQAAAAAVAVVALGAAKRLVLSAALVASQLRAASPNGQNAKSLRQCKRHRWAV